MILKIKEKENARRFLDVINGFAEVFGHRKDMEAAQEIINSAVLEMKNAAADELDPELGPLQIRVGRMLGEIYDKSRPIVELMEKTIGAMRELVIAARPDIRQYEIGIFLFDDEVKEILPGPNPATEPPQAEINYFRTMRTNEERQALQPIAHFAEWLDTVVEDGHEYTLDLLMSLYVAAGGKKARSFKEFHSRIELYAANTRLLSVTTKRDKLRPLSVTFDIMPF